MNTRQTRERGEWTINVVIDGSPSTGYRVRNQTIRHGSVGVLELVKVDRPELDFLDDLEAFKAAFAACRIKIESKGEIYKYL